MSNKIHADNEEPERAAPPAQTHVGCLNYICRWIGGCDCQDTGIPNLREGVLKNRACTDVLWIAICALFSLLCVLFIWIPASSEGKIERFLGANDFMLNTCGRGDMADFKYGAWPLLTEYEILGCVASCDDTSSFTIAYTSEASVFWCLPSSGTDSYAEWEEKYNENMFYRYMSDMYTYRMVPIMAAPVTCLMLIGFFIFVRFFLKLILKVLYVGLLVGTIFGGYCFMQDGREADPAGFYTGVAIITLGTSLWCVIMCCWNQLMEVVDIMKSASAALILMPQVMAVPIVTLPITVGIIIAWYLITLLLFSAGDPASSAMPAGLDLELAGMAAYIPASNPDLGGVAPSTASYDTIQYDFNLQKTFFVHLFWMFWGIKFMEYFNFVVVAGCVADWYLDQELVDNPEENEEFKAGNFCRVCYSLWRTIRYHLGSIAFGSALIAAIQTLEAILLYIKRQMGESTNPFAAMILRIVIAVVHCIECIMDRCNKTTLVVTAVLGTPFCAGCGKSVALFFKNMALMSLGTGMIVLMCTLANFLIAILAAGFCGYIYLSGESDLNSTFMPLLSAFLVSFFIGKMILAVWDCAATTILVCHCMLKEWYPNEFGKGLVGKANKVKKSDLAEGKKEVLPDLVAEDIAI